MSVNRAALKEAVNAHSSEKSTAQIQHRDNFGIVECLRAVIRPTAPAKQADILYNLCALANAPGFDRESLLTAIGFLLEANTVVLGGPPSEYGLKALMREDVKE